MIHDSFADSDVHLAYTTDCWIIGAMILAVDDYRGKSNILFD